MLKILPVARDIKFKLARVHDVFAILIIIPELFRRYFKYNDAVFVNNANDMPNALQNLFVKILGGNKQINKRLAS